MAHDHRHADSPSGRHTHGVAEDADVRYMGLALALIGIFMVVEVVAGALAGSLALLADAGHMLTDVAALGASVWAARLAARPPGGIWTFGLKRAEILSAAGNGVALVAVGALIASDAIRRLIAPGPVHGGVVAVVAGAGAFVNLAAAALLSRANRSNLNVRAAAAHVLTDLYAFVATLAAGVVILLTGWTRADPVASLLVAALMAGAAWSVLREAGLVLLQAAPQDVALEQVRAHLAGVEHVIDVHDLHVWTLSSDLPTLSAHVVVEDHCFATGHAPQILDILQACLGEHFDVEHSTFQLEPASHAAHELGSHP